MRKLVPYHWLAVLLAVPALQAQSAQQRVDIPAQLGLPPVWRFSAGLYYQSHSAPSEALGMSVYHDIINPAFGALGVQLDSYLAGNARNGSIALGLRSPVLRIGAGIAVDWPHAAAAPFVAMTHPLLRGGLLPGVLHGVTARGSWVFGSDRPLRAGISIPIAQPWVGKDRPRSDRVQLPTPRPPAARLPGRALQHAAVELQNWALRVNALVVPSLDSARTLATQLAPASSYGAGDVVRAYHTSLENAVTLALSGNAASHAVADSVRAVLLRELLLPYDRLLGQKREPKTLAPFRAAAVRSVSAYGGDVQWIVEQLIVAFDQIARVQRAQWHDERLVWLPLQLALTDAQHRTQAQVDSLLEQLTHGEFSDSNEIAYVRNEQFQWELFRTIHDARSYHVLWVHDFRGLNDARTPDTVAYRQVAFGYLDAMIDRVRSYDREGALPEWHIILDQYYYELNRSRLWLPLLRDPLHARFRPRNVPLEWRATIDSLQAALRNAVASSARLQQDARAKGQKWLRDRIGVHVHVAQQADPTFWSTGIIPIVGLPDNALRDHRKLVFYDLTEGDPYRGALIVTGMGVGETYSGPGWEDRAVVLRGTAALAAKNEALALLTGNGIAHDRLPFFLRPRSDTVAVGTIAPTPTFELGAVTAMQLHNRVGYGDKRVTAAKAALYSLLPAGAVVKLADPLWINPLWSSLLLGHALRGGRVLLIAPARANAPSAGAGEMTLMEELLSRTLVASAALRPALDRSGGMLRVGIYDAQFPVDDIPARIETALSNRARLPWLRELEPFSREVFDSLRAVAADLRHDVAGSGTPIHSNDKPKLHMKAQFVASAEAYANLFQQRGWGRALAQYFRANAQMLRERPRYAEFFRLPDTTSVGTGGALALREEVAARQAERVLYYLVLGSFNADYRSSLLDGESAIVISRFGAAIGIADFVLLPSLCTWVETPAELHQYVPPTRGRARRLAHALWILY